MTASRDNHDYAGTLRAWATRLRRPMTPPQRHALATLVEATAGTLGEELTSLRAYAARKPTHFASANRAPKESTNS